MSWRDQAEERAASFTPSPRARCRLKLLMTNRSNPWDADGPEIEGLVEAVEQDGLSYSMAMVELLRALYGLSQTLANHPSLSPQPVSAKDTSANKKSQAERGVS
jgi:hypothetical protein